MTPEPRTISCKLLNQLTDTFKTLQDATVERAQLIQSHEKALARLDATINTAQAKLALLLDMAKTTGD